MNPPDESERRPGWQHPAFVGSVMLFALLAIFGAVALGSSDDEGADATEVDPDDDPTPSVPDPAPQPDPLPSVQPTPSGLPLIAPERPDRAAFVGTAQEYVDAWLAVDTESLAALTWSGCSSSGQVLSTEIEGRMGPPATGFRLETAIVISASLGVIDLVSPDDSVRERLIFTREQSQWRSGLCDDPTGDLAQTVELPDDVVALAGLDFSGEQLQQQPLQLSDFAHARFDGADMSQANLFGAIIEGASFRGADLTEAWAPEVVTGTIGADFSDSVLRETKFYDADLDAADFTGADARNADFGGATLRDAIFRDADLDGAFIDPSSARRVADWTGAICPDGQLAETDRGCLDHLNPFG